MFTRIARSVIFFLLACITCTLVLGSARAVTKETGASLSAQSAADVLKTYAQTDGAFLAAGLVKDTYDKAQDLSTLLLYPDDQLMVLKLTGLQLKEAFERSVSLYPQPNTSFLQLAGFEVTFSKSGAIGKRVVSATANGAAIDNAKTYTVAMPTSLGRGGLGYFKIWDKSDIVKTYDTVTVESILKGKPYVATSPRWSASA